MAEPNVNATQTVPTIDPNAKPVDQSAVPQEPVVDDKKTNRTFSQSEHDAEIARVQRETAAKYTDYDTLKEQNDKLLADKKQRELDEMSDTEKAKTEAEELKIALEKATAVNEALQLNQLKSDILSTPEFDVLPRAYRTLIKGTDEASITEDAKRVVEEYKADIKNTGGAVDFGPKVTKDKAPNPKPAQSTVKDLIAAAGERFNIGRPEVPK